MGIIDQTTYTVTCPKCSASESATILQHGSAYGGSWQSGKPMGKFTVTWDNSGAFAHPGINASKCNACGAIPNVEIS